MLMKKAVCISVVFSLISCLLLLGALQLSVSDTTTDEVTRLLADQSFVSHVLATVCLINLLNYFI